VFKAETVTRLEKNIHLAAEMQNPAPQGFADALRSRQWMDRAISLIEAALAQLGDAEHPVQSALTEAAQILRQESRALSPVDCAAVGYRALSCRESSILRMIAHGMSNKRIAQTLGIAPETVKSHAKNIFVKLSTRTRAQAVARAESIGFL
jgi:ATP/maltotriose-dependent transcriptional regulator MalT